MNYNWHDLRKNEKDLPPLDEQVYIAYTDKLNTIHYSCGHYSILIYDMHEWFCVDGSLLDTVIGWKHIEPIGD